MAKWPPDRLALLKSMRAENKSFGQIARALGCTIGAVAGQVHRMKKVQSAEANKGLPDRRTANGLCMWRDCQKPVSGNTLFCSQHLRERIVR